MEEKQTSLSASREKSRDLTGLLLFLAVVLAMIGINAMVHISAGDDAVNLEAMKHYGWLSWVKMRYLTWSGRISNEMIGYIGLNLGNWFFWLTNPLFVLLAGYSCARLVAVRPTFRQIAFALMAFSLMNVRTQTSSLFWISGSYGYIMPAAFGLFTLIPFADCFFRDQNRINLTHFIIFTLAAVMATLGNEPLSLVITAFALLCLFYKLLKREKVSPYLWILAIICVAGTFVILHSPGSTVRWHTELRWFPGFDKLTMGAHAKISVQFVFDSLVNQNALLLLVVTAVPFLYADRYRRGYRIILYLYTVMWSAFLATKLLTGIHQTCIYDFRDLYDFSYYRSNYYAALTFAHVMPYILWSAFAVCLILLVTHISEHPWFDALCFLATAATLLVITVSPTIYASGSRVLFIGSLILAFVIVRFTTLSRQLQNNLFLCTFAVLSGCNVASYAIEWLIKGYSVIL